MFLAMYSLSFLSICNVLHSRISEGGVFQQDIDLIKFVKTFKSMKSILSRRNNLTILLNRSPTSPKEKAKTMSTTQKKLLLKIENSFLFPIYISSIFYLSLGGLLTEKFHNEDSLVGQISK